MVAPAVLLAILLVVLPGLLYVWAGLPSTANLSTARLPLSTRIYDRTGTILLAEIHQGSERRRIVPLKQVAPAMQQATIAVDDRSFYQHGGLNLLRTDHAGLPQAPTELDPITNFNGAKARQRVVLDAMVRNHAITPAQADSAYAQKLTPQKASTADDVKAPGFVHWVAAQLEKTYGGELLKNGGLTVFTSLDWNLQSIAERQVREKVSALQGQHVTDGALVALDPKSGAVLAMVGSAGPDVPGGQYNMAITPRQPGSAFKIFTYTAAVESQKFTMGSWVLDQPINVRMPDGSTYTPHNYDGSYHGWQPLPFALGNSFNIPAVKVELGTGTDRVVDVARRMGLTSLNQPASSYQPSLTLGGYEVPLIEFAAGPGTLAAQGTYVHPRAIPKLTAHAGS